MNRQSTAYHEAGHAVVSWCLRVPVKHATIVPAKDSLGHITNHKMNHRTAVGIEWADRFSPSRLQAEKMVMVCMAGEIAQRKYNPRCVRCYGASGDRHDAVGLLMRYADLVGPDEVIDIRAHWKLLHGWTKELIDQKWYLVESVANALLDRQTLSGRELADVILTARAEHFEEGAESSATSKQSGVS